ncbi:MULTISPECIES: AI-2E family transporter [unclassified Clostridium]|uniref:AI-2E family transporter n=1 Tax=unclassified Clostridium TaxID=2614128 RepID=UPI0011068C7B|nr:MULTISPECIES: AI-2E family transporter [unclassified Clostridium]
MRMRKPDPRYFKPAFYLFVTAAALLLFQQGLSSLGNLWGALGQAAAGLWQGMLPLSCGAILAYILRPLASGLEKGCLRIFPGLEKKARALSLGLLYALIGGALALTAAYALPAVYANLIDAAACLPQDMAGLKAQLGGLLARVPLLSDPALTEGLLRALDEAAAGLTLNLSALAGQVAYHLMNGLGILMNLGLGVVVSFYLLAEREKLAAIAGRLTGLFLSRDRQRHLRSLVQEIDRAFGQYVTARLVETALLALVLMAGFSLSGLRFGALVGVLVAVLNLIPYIGSLIGGALVALVGLMDGTQVVLGGLCYLLVAQALDNYIILPRLFGNALGLSPALTLIAVLAGGGLFGIPGMILAVPIGAVAQVLVRRALSQRGHGPR